MPVLFSFTGEQRSTVLIGTTYFILFLLTSAASRRAGYFAELFRDLPAGINFTFISGALFVLFSGLTLIAGWYALAIPFFVMLYIVQAFRRPLNVAYLSEMISNRIMATGLSGDSQLQTLFSALFSLLMGVMVEYAGLAAAITVVALVTLLCYPVVKIKAIHHTANGQKS